MVISRQMMAGSVERNLEWLIKPEDGKRLDRLPATAAPDFFPCRRGGIPRETKKQASAVLRWRYGPRGCGPIAPRA